MRLGDHERALFDTLMGMAACTRAADIAHALARVLQAHTQVERARLVLGRPHGERVWFAWERGQDVVELETQLETSEPAGALGGHKLALVSGGDEVGELELDPVASSDQDAVALAAQVAGSCYERGEVDRQLEMLIGNELVVALEREQALRVVLDSMPNALLVVRPDGTLGDLRSRATTQWLGEPAQGARLETYVGLGRPELEARWARGLAALASPEGLNGALTEWPHLIELGDRELEASYRPILADGALAGVSIMLRDATLERARGRAERARNAELEQALAELQRTQGELVQAQKLAGIGQLAAGVAHEINTPIQYVGDNLAFVRRATDTLYGLLAAYQAATSHLPEPLRAGLEAKAKRAKLDYLRRETPKAFDQSADGVSRVATIVAAMKRFAHTSHGEKAPVDLRELIDTTLTVSRGEWKYVAEAEVAVEDGLGPVPVLRDELGQALLNLIVNAAHAIGDVVGDGSRGKGTLRLEARAEGDWAVVRVSDTGAGIPEHLRDRIFEPFFTTKAVGRGTGQGLAIARAVVVDKHQGVLEVQSEVGRGTTFTLRLPRRAARKDADAA